MTRSIIWLSALLIFLTACKKKIEGCKDPEALNYEKFADFDDGSCVYESGCTDPNAVNYDSDAIIDNGSCIYVITGCMDSLADNYNPNATISSGNCVYSGCTNPCAENYNPAATIDNGSCIDKKALWSSTYTINESCVFSLSNNCEISIPSGAQLCDSLLLIENLFSNSSNGTDTAYINNTSINFPWQSYVTNIGTTAEFMGSGTISFVNNKYEIELNFTHTVAFGQNLNCNATLIQQ